VFCELSMIASSEWSRLLSLPGGRGYASDGSHIQPSFAAGNDVASGYPGSTVGVYSNYDGEQEGYYGGKYQHGSPGQVRWGVRDEKANLPCL